MSQGSSMAPKFGLKTLLQSLLFYGQTDEKVFGTSGSVRAESEVGAVFKASKAFCLVSVQIKDSAPRFVLVCRGLANSGIHRWQYLPSPRNSPTCLLAYGVRI